MSDPQASAAPAANPDDLVRVYNRAKKSYTHEIYVGDRAGRDPAKYVAAPNSFCTIPRFIAELWLKGYPDDILPGDQALAAIDPGAAANAELQAKNDELQRQADALKAEIDALKAKLAAG